MGLRLAELAPSCSSHTKECETKYYYIIQCNLSFGTPLFKKLLHSEETKFGPGKTFTQFLY